ncbi:hypothetical protein AVEN_21163-1 [Araneus ventricosus]|uniref:DUF4817 domain-containing protein n=1 Tax=Araneus ventricosus TaxID=182803 RepID=A0A4Y2V154_ARAVE|nr:hypothetical protein AVEN_21163-1 [Araneus ventricosus]
MAFEKKERPLLLKLFYQNGSNLSTALLEYPCSKDLQKGNMSRKNMIIKFEGIGNLGFCKQEDGSGIQRNLRKQSLLPRSKESPVPNILRQVPEWSHVVCLCLCLQYERIFDSL